MSRSPVEVILGPVVTERSYTLYQQGRYTFRVAKNATKQEIARAIEEQYEPQGIKVLAVNIVQVPSKPKQRNYIRGRRPAWKKAIVQLREGNTIEIFEGAQV